MDVIEGKRVDQSSWKTTIAPNQTGVDDSSLEPTFAQSLPESGQRPASACTRPHFPLSSQTQPKGLILLVLLTLRALCSRSSNG